MASKNSKGKQNKMKFQKCENLFFYAHILIDSFELRDWNNYEYWNSFLDFNLIAIRNGIDERFEFKKL